MQEIVKEIIEALKKFKEVEAISLGGSIACGCSDENSDVDIYVFYRNTLTNDSIRKMKLHNLAKFELAFTGGIIDYFIHRGLHIHTWWEDLGKVEKNLKERPDDMDSKTLILNPKLVWDRNGKVKKLRKEIKYPRWSISKWMIERNLDLVPGIFRDVLEKSIIRKKVYFAEWTIIHRTDNLIKAIYMLNRKYYGNYPQHLKCDFQRFKLVPRNAYENINKIGRYSLMEKPKEKLTALYELYWATKELFWTRSKPEKRELFPEYDDKKWYRKRILEISKAIEDMKRRV